MGKEMNLFSYFRKSNWLVAACATVTVVAISGQVALAESCFEEPAKLSPDSISSFLNDPEALLTNNPVGGYGLAREVRNLSGSDDQTIDEIVSLAETASPEQVAAVGAGLAQAATACITSSPEVSEAIQLAIAESENLALISTFAAATGNTQVAALGVGAVGGTGGTGAGGGAGIAGGSVAGGESGPDTFVANSAFSLTTDASASPAIRTNVSPVQ